ncbi:hypothetical protein KL905_001613 [Ogataea polymorpha]|uniref:C2H2-type domain-containing protein n=2 Tax=Ogataea polymorpha TaxID=460523 RepID=A0A9P8T489_9ASCO|nr:hypothetical protein KL937_000084 [Ogataea polymorpha]KAG7895597.1 hypothetical protein KL936_000305 [Ogataea polymorpha]KAG7904327.1 hypothetical protein KL935_000466 [Ogataea polymorpha]KAG7905936.1 hypothetical protein KL906_005006 [Ogataea polymorpha]KAG7908171.1 hypothetical protein KL907_001661 [Ogataea polymorpha]
MFGQTANDSTQPINISFSRTGSVYQNPRIRRESIAHSQGMGGISWGSVTIGSWLKDEVMLHAHQQQNTHNNNLSPFLGANHSVNTHMITNNFDNLNRTDSLSMAFSPSINNTSYLADLEATYCKDYSCCGQLLPTLHDLLRHYEEMHIQPEQPLETPRARPVNTAMDTVSTNEVFLTPQGSHDPNVRTQQSQGGHGVPDSLATFSFNQQPNNDTQSRLGYNIQYQQSQQDLLNHSQGHLTQNALQQQHPTLFQNYNNQLPQRQQSPLSSQPTPHTNHANTIPPRAGSPRQFAMDEDEDMEEDSEVCIDDPARHLYVMEQGESRPFKCPVIGCDKNYKNQNGLKYHRLHGHQNQTLRANPDGTFSVIDPESDAPYPDGMGMEKDKPYRCEVCGKRYKNLNGLKYHRGHSTH